MPRAQHGKAQKREGEMAHMERKQKDGENVLGGGSKYPHGLRVHVDHEGLKKLDMAELPQVG
ncbi:hypothetical protein NO135_23275, partial [Clostridioides difficile]|nr:hypothetical protein [Clostridioides difficile]